MRLHRSLRGRRDPQGRRKQVKTTDIFGRTSLLGSVIDIVELLCWVSHTSPLCWVLLTSPLCWMSHTSPLCWISWYPKENIQEIIFQLFWVNSCFDQQLLYQQLLFPTVFMTNSCYDQQLLFPTAVMTNSCYYQQLLWPTAVNTNSCYDQQLLFLTAVMTNSCFLHPCVVACLSLNLHVGKYLLVYQ